jgi:hypothetical protein
VSTDFAISLNTFGNPHFLISTFVYDTLQHYIILGTHILLSVPNSCKQNI